MLTIKDYSASPKPNGSVPPHLVDSLTAAARMSEQLDKQMEELYAEVRDS